MSDTVPPIDDEPAPPSDIALAVEALLAAAQTAVDHVERDEAHEGGLLGRDTLRVIGELRLQLHRWNGVVLA